MPQSDTLHRTPRPFADDGPAQSSQFTPTASKVTPLHFHSHGSNPRHIHTQNDVLRTTLHHRRPLQPQVRCYSAWAHPQRRWWSGPRFIGRAGRAHFPSPIATLKQKNRDKMKSSGGPRRSSTGHMNTLSRFEGGCNASLRSMFAR